MCSNCSGDDPKPESFALFDLSSPKSGERFAEPIGRSESDIGQVGLSQDPQKLH
jgi:hypothetical protein